ncbi:hypothetical protein [Amycolatopsis sp. 195334CR]|uniref:hypothetical protein n=1 Tax=Amycolatopsis sp. 195334CR TaxID=2814588 RepID=UPI001A90151B|nr:hypothetical protein [Amycolatopsis sp. 195334CR]MBN6034062.1 hypothetical protein [Amycolatopsis sp. 195334CR]
MRQRKQLVFAGVFALMLSSCTSGAGENASDAGSRQVLSPTQAAEIDAGPHLKVTLGVGAVDREAILSATPTEVEAPRLPGFIAAAPPVEIAVSVPLAKPVRLTFDGVGGPVGTVPVLLHYDGAVGWYPVEVGEAPGAIVADRMALSPFATGWITSAAEWLRDRAVGKTAPPTCGSPPPKWAQPTMARSDMTTGCVTDNSGRVELRVRNNRGLPVEVSVPRGVAYADVQGQSETVRKIVRDYVGGDKVVLMPGQDVTMGWARPSEDTQITVQTEFTAGTILPGLAMELLGLNDSTSLAALAYFLADCGDAKTLVLDAPDSSDALGVLIQTLVTCTAQAVTSPGGAAAAAVSAVAAANGRDQATVVADREFSGKVDKLANGLRLFGKFVKIYTAAKLVAALAQVVVDNTSPTLDRAFILNLGGSVSAQRVATFTGYGGVTVGMTKQQAVEKSSTPLSEHQIGPCTYLTDSGGDRTGGLSILLNRDGRVIGIRVPAKARTDKGIRVGSTYAEAEAAYRGSPIERDADAGGYHLLVIGPGGAIGFHSMDEAGPVESIVVGREDYAKGFELCSDSEPPN